MKLNMDKSLVGIHDFLHRNALSAMEYERRGSIIIFIQLLIILLAHSLDCPCIDTRKDSSCKVTPERHEIHHRCILRLRRMLYLHQILLDLGKMLMGKQLINGNVV